MSCAVSKQKANKTQCVAGNLSSGQMSSPLGSPRSTDILSDKELEEIIKFINGVGADNAVAASAAGGAMAKQKTAKHKSKKVTFRFVLCRNAVCTLC